MASALSVDWLFEWKTLKYVEHEIVAAMHVHYRERANLQVAGVFLSVPYQSLWNGGVSHKIENVVNLWSVDHRRVCKAFVRRCRMLRCHSFRGWQSRRPASGRSMELPGRLLQAACLDGACMQCLLQFWGPGRVPDLVRNLGAFRRRSITQSLA